MVWKPFEKHHRSDMVYTLALLESGGEVVHPVTMLRFEKAKGRFYDSCNNMTFPIGDNRLLGWKPTPSKLDRPAFKVSGTKISFAPRFKSFLSGVAFIAVGTGLYAGFKTGDPLNFVFITALVFALFAAAAVAYQYFRFGDPFA